MENGTQHDARLAFLKAINKVQGLIEHIVKDSTNPHFKSTYASLIAVNTVVMPIISENGLVLLQGGHDIAGKPYLRTTLCHVAGHYETFDYPIILDLNPQHTASQITYARRYSICAMLNLSVDDDDGEGASKDVRTVTAEATQRAVPVLSEQTTSGDAKFVPSKVVFMPGKGKGAGKTFSAIYGPKGEKYDGDEMQGQMAEAAQKAEADLKERGAEIAASAEKPKKTVRKAKK